MDRTGMASSIGRAAGLVLGVLVLGWLLAPAALAVGSPDLGITKSSDAAGTLSVGDRFSYTLSVTNDGDTSAHTVVLQDNLPRGVAVRTLIPSFPGGTCTVASSQLPPAPPSWSVRCTRDVLDPGERADVTFEVALTSDVRCGPLTNIVVATAKDEPSSSEGDNRASVTDDVACEPAIGLETTAPTYARAGTSVPFTMKVHNDGQIAFGVVELTGPGCSPVRIGGGGSTLTVGETWTYRCTRAVGRATPDPLTAEATVRAWTDDEQMVSASDAATVRIVDPGISISVTPSPVSGTPGETITYSYTVSNTGDTRLSGIVVTDDHLGRIGDIPELLPGHDATLRATRVLDASDVWVTNTAMARGTDVEGDAVTDTDEAAITIVASGTGNGDGTAFTGLDATPAATIAVLLGALGAGLLLAARRRV